MTRLLLIASVLVLCLATPAHADFAAGKAAYDTKKWEQAVLNLRPLAEQGDARAMVLLGNMYAQGYGVRKSDKDAYKLYHRAALAGNSEAMVVTGAMLQQGMGVDMDVQQAVQWYERAAETGQPGGAFFYALYLFRGSNANDAEKNILPNPPLSYRWMRICEKISKDQKMKKAAGQLADEIAKQLKPDERKAADEAVASWKAKTVADLGPAPGVTP